MQIIPTNSTTSRPLNWTSMARNGLTLSLVSLALLAGLAQGCAPSASPTPQSTGSLSERTEDVSNEPVQTPQQSEEVVVSESPAIEWEEYRVTAYCACEKCCGKWALNRPNGIVYGAAGIELTPGVSCAAPLPFGTVLEIEGYGEVIVQDRIAQWVLDEYGNNCVDIYFGSHDEARAFALQYMNVREVQ